MGEFNKDEAPNEDCLYEASNVSDVTSQVVAGLLWKFKAEVGPSCDNVEEPKVFVSLFYYPFLGLQLFRVDSSRWPTSRNHLHPCG